MKGESLYTVFSKALSSEKKAINEMGRQGCITIRRNI
jgi:hypothetical protein